MNSLNSQKNIQFVFDAIGTGWVIDIYTPYERWNEKINLEALLEQIKKRIDEFDKNYSRFRGDSLVKKMASNTGVYVLPDDAKLLFDLYYKLYQITEGALTPLIGNVMEQAGYDANYSLVPKVLEKPDSWSEILNYQFPTLTLKKPMLLDVGALGKGYLIDIVSDILRSNNIRHFCVDAGGDMFFENKELEKSFVVGLEDPRDTSLAIGTINLKNNALCGSAGNKRAWGNFHHIINPHTLTSPTNILATWVVAKNTLLADGLASALFFTDPEKLQPYFDFEYVILLSDGSVKTNKSFSGELFYQSNMQDRKIA